MLLDINTKLSVYNKQLSGSPFDNVTGSVSLDSKIGGSSFQYKLNNMGERMYPCLTPLLNAKKLVCT